MADIPLPATQTVYTQSATALIEHYRTLVNHAEKVLFPSQAPKLLAVINLEGRSKWRAFLFHAFFPYTFFTNLNSPIDSGLQFFIFGLWAVFGSMWIALAPRVPISAAHWLPSFLLITSFLWIPIAYLQLIWFLFNKHTSWRARGAWALSAILLVAISFIQSPTPGSQPFVLVYSVELYISLFLIPALIVYSFLTFSVIILLFQALSALLNTLLTSMIPTSYPAIRQLVFDPIASDNGPWRLCDCSPQELAALQHLAQQNTESNEKKTVPGLFLFSLLSVLVAINPPNSGLTKLLQWAADSVSLYFSTDSTATFAETIAGFFIAASVVFFLITLIFHYRNHTIQGIIAQACIVAEHARAQELASAAPPPKSTLEILVAWLAKFITGV
jgi:hypothetical protein